MQRLAGQRESLWLKWMCFERSAAAKPEVASLKQQQTVVMHFRPATLCVIVPFSSYRGSDNCLIWRMLTPTYERFSSLCFRVKTAGWKIRSMLNLFPTSPGSRVFIVCGCSAGRISHIVPEYSTLASSLPHISLRGCSGNLSRRTA